jgi:type IV pilus assembly protein PilB
MGHGMETFHKGVGCKSCRNTGYKGRIGVHELLVISDELRDAIVANPNISHLRQIARRSGMIQLADDGFRKVREGITTIEEVLHIAGDVRQMG